MADQRDKQIGVKGPPLAPPTQGASRGAPNASPTPMTPAADGSVAGPLQSKPIEPGVSGTEPTPHLPPPSPPYKNLRSGR